MQRDPARLTAHTFDLLVVGGGVCGLTIACDAAQRGLSVALVEQHDFGSGSSFNHFRTIHGGLRYLQGLDLARTRLSIRERRTLARIAPFALKPQAFVLPLTRSLTKGRLATRTGFALDRFLGTGRNRGVSESLMLPPGRVMSKTEAIERFPGLRRQGLTGAALWYDYATTEADRLTLAWALAAHAHGAVLANYVEATGPLGAADRVEGVRAVDRLTGGSLDIAAGVTVNAAGAGRVRLAPGGHATRLLRALNLVTRRDAGDEAIGARTRSGRHLFLLPWRGRALFGTWESAGFCSPDEPDAPADEVGQFIEMLNAAFPSLDLTLADITLVHRGLVPAFPASDGRAVLEGRDRIADHGSGPEPTHGLITVAAAKYTTARALAQRAVDLVVAKLARQAAPCRTAATPLPGGELGDIAVAIGVARREYEDRLPSQSIPHLVAAYGARYRDVAELALQRDEWRAPLAPGAHVIGAEMVHAVRHEMAVTLADAVVRRTPLGALGFPGETALDTAARIMGSECGWTDEQRRQELDAVRRFYA